MVWKPVKFPLEKRVQLAQGLWLLSWLATLGASCTVALGCFLETELHQRREVMAYTDIYIVPNILMMTGLVCMGINFFIGRICQDALEPGRFPRWAKFMRPFFGFSIFITSLMIVSIILSFVMRWHLDRSLRLGLRNGIRYYRDTDTPGRCYQKQSIDLMQMEFRCCGSNNFRDWFEVQWVSNRYLDFSSKEVKDRIKSNVDGRYLQDGVPFSCCNPKSPRPCIQHQITNNSVHYNYDYSTEELNIYTRGCREALVYYYMGLMNSIGGGVLAIFLVQSAVLVGLRYLQTSMDALVGKESQEVETEGYLLEKSATDTLKDLLEPVITLLMLNEVEAMKSGEKKAEEGAKK